jgi:hypothetical protein
MVGNSAGARVRGRVTGREIEGLGNGLFSGESRAGAVIRGFSGKIGRCAVVEGGSVGCRGWFCATLGERSSGKTGGGTIGNKFMFSVEEAVSLFSKTVSMAVVGSGAASPYAASMAPMRVNNIKVTKRI